MKDSLYIIAAGALWGILSIFIRGLNAAGLNSMQCVAIRALLTAVLLLGYLLFTDRNKLKIHPKDIPYFLGTGIASIVFFNYCYFEAIEVIGGAAVPALLLYTAPLFVMLLSAIFFGERITKPKLIALCMTFVGLGFVTGAFSGGQTLSVKAILLGLGAGLGYALYSIFGKPLSGKYESTTITFYTFLIAAIATVPMSGILEQLPLLRTPQTFLTAIGLALFSTVLPFLLYTKGLQGIEAGKASILATVEPFVAAVVGVTLFQEQLTPEKLLGMVCVICAILYLNLGGKRKKQSVKTENKTEISH